MILAVAFWLYFIPLFNTKRKVMYIGLMHLHSFLRWVVLILIIVATARAFFGWFGKKEFSPIDKKISLFTMISAHIQLLVGLVLYFVSPVVKSGWLEPAKAMRDKDLRFWTVEHIAAMVLAIALVTVGHIMAKKADEASKKHRRIAVYFLLALILIFYAIPWPFSEVSRGWF